MEGTLMSDRNRMYRRATSRRVDRVRHLYWAANGRPLCGERPHEYTPAPGRFLAGDVRPDVYAIDCPICAAIEIVFHAERSIQQGDNNNRKDRRQAA